MQHKIENSDKFKYFAFISYNVEDQAWGSRLQTKLEHYKMPTELCKEKGWKRKPTSPIFFAPTDIQPNDLSEELKSRLRASRNLIVICSPNSAKSGWVGREIRYFYSLGRKQNIHFFIIKGSPNDNNKENECYNPVIKELGMNNFLGANINEKYYKLKYLNRQRAYIQLITKLLGIEFDTIWNRHKRILIKKLTIALISLLILTSALIGFWKYHQPIETAVTLKELTLLNNKLPELTVAKLSLIIDDEIRHVNLNSIKEKAIFKNIPRKLIGKTVKLQFIEFPDMPEAANYYPLTVEKILEENIEIHIQRDTVKYGRLRVKIIDEKYKARPYYELSIAGMKFKTDAEGNIDTLIPYAKQQEFYTIGKDTISDIGLTSRIALIIP